MDEFVNVGLIQMECTVHIEDNFSKATALIKEAARRGAQIVCTQELFKSRYFPQVQDPKYLSLAEPLGGDSPTIRALSTLARELEIVLIATLFEKRAAGIYHNTAVVLDADGSMLGKYRKMHIPDYPLFYEKFYFTPGDLGYRVFRTRFADISVLVCWDQWFPEASRLSALAGAQIIFYPTAIGSIPQEKGMEDALIEAWQIVQRGHAVANCCYVAAVNRVGFEPHPNGDEGIQFWGHSFVADPLGAIQRQASANTEEVIITPMNLTRLEQLRDTASFYRDRRVDSYAGLTRIYLDQEA
jgi:N-carbamoylputrescine amidase